MAGHRWDITIWLVCGHENLDSRGCECDITECEAPRFTITSPSARCIRCEMALPGVPDEARAQELDIETLLARGIRLRQPRSPPPRFVSFTERIAARARANQQRERVHQTWLRLERQVILQFENGYLSANLRDRAHRLHERLHQSIFAPGNEVLPSMEEHRRLRDLQNIEHQTEAYLDGHLARRVSQVTDWRARRTTLQAARTNLIVLAEILQVSNEEGHECSICSASIPHDNGEDGVITECGHLYGRECIMNWLMRSNRCPMCRTNLFERNPMLRNLVPGVPDMWDTPPSSDAES